jgi:hypothetical protein
MPIYLRDSTLTHAKTSVVIYKKLLSSYSDSMGYLFHEQRLQEREVLDEEVCVDVSRQP